MRLSNLQKIGVLVGLQVLSLVAAVIDGHTKFFNGYFGVLDWAAFGIGVVGALIYMFQAME